MDVLKELPPEAAVLPPKQQVTYWFIANRVRMGVLLLAIVTAVSASVDGEVGRRWLHVAELLIVLVTGAAGGGLVGAGGFDSNKEHEQKMNQAIKRTTGQYPAVHPRRREGER